MRFFFQLLAALAVTIGVLPGCEKVIDLDLRESDRRIVIESQINTEGLCYAKVSRVNNYNDNNVFPEISGATVLLSDDLGTEILFAEISPGLYLPDSFAAVPGRTYTLSVTVDGEVYTSKSTTPFPVNIDSLSTRKELFFVDADLVTICHFVDPAEFTNYYRYVYTINNVTGNDYILDTDELYNGQAVNTRLFSFGIEPDVGDSITIELWGLDRASHDYFLTLETAIDGASGQQAAPANPISRFTNGAMGYFCAYTVSRASIIVED